MLYVNNLLASWCGFAMGAVVGSLIGLNFHHENWLEGYQSFSRRLLRLGHVAFFGLGFLNIMFVMSVQTMSPSIWLDIASMALLIGLITMPTLCFLSSWRKTFCRWFFIPVGAVLLGVICTLIGAI